MERGSRVWYLFHFRQALWRQFARFVLARRCNRDNVLLWFKHFAVLTYIPRFPKSLIRRWYNDCAATTGAVLQDLQGLTLTRRVLSRYGYKNLERRNGPQRLRGSDNQYTYRFSKMQKALLQLI